MFNTIIFSMNRRTTTFIDPSASMSSNTAPDTVPNHKTCIFLYCGKTWENAASFYEKDGIQDWLKKKLVQGKNGNITICGEKINTTSIPIEIIKLTSQISRENITNEDLLNYEIERLRSDIGSMIAQGFTHIHFFTTDIGYLILALLSQILNNESISTDPEGSMVSQTTLHRRSLEENPIFRSVITGHSQTLRTYTPTLCFDGPRDLNGRIKSYRKVSIVTHATPHQLSKLSKKPLPRTTNMDTTNDNSLIKFLNPIDILDDSPKAPDDVTGWSFNNVFERQSTPTQSRAAPIDFSNTSLTLHMLGDLPHGPEIDSMLCDVCLDFFIVKHYPLNVRPYTNPLHHNQPTAPVVGPPQTTFCCCGAFCSCWNTMDKEQKEMIKTCAKIAFKLTIGLVVMFV